MQATDAAAAGVVGSNDPASAGDAALASDPTLAADAALASDPARGGDAALTSGPALATDLYALVLFLHKNCNSDLLEAIGALELTLTQIKLLHHLEDQPRELTLKQASELVHVSLPAASRTVDDLVRRGLARRREDEEDRRMKRVCLTEDGRTVIRRLNAARLSGLEQFTQTLAPAERLLLAQALGELLERADVAACRPET